MVFGDKLSEELLSRSNVCQGRKYRLQTSGVTLSSTSHKYRLQINDVILSISGHKCRLQTSNLTLSTIGFANIDYGKWFNFKYYWPYKCGREVV